MRQARLDAAVPDQAHHSGRDDRSADGGPETARGLLSQLPGLLDMLARGGALTDREADHVATARTRRREVEAAAIVEGVQRALVQRVEGGLVEARRAVADIRRRPKDGTFGRRCQ